MSLGAILIIAHATLDHGGQADLAAMFALLAGFALVALAMSVLYLRLGETHRQAAETETAFQTAVQSLTDGFAIYDTSNALVLANERIRDMVSDLDDAHALLDDETPAQERKLSDGRWVLLRAHGLPCGGKALVCTDITTLKNREQAILDHATRYRDMVERSPVPIYVHRDLIVIYANTATAKALGYPSPQAIVGKNIFDLVHPDDHKLLQRRVQEVAEKDGPLSKTDMKFIRRDGDAIYTEAQVSPVIFDGEPALESILYDVTARKKAERGMRESELRYRNLFELSPDAIIVHDGRDILFANDAAAQMLGAERDIDLFGMSIDALKCHADQTSPLSISGSLDTHGEGAARACQVCRLDGVSFDAEVVVAFTPHHGEVVQQAVIRDVTQRKRMDAAMTQNAKLASLGSMAAGLAHELSQPLNIMRFAAEGGLLKMNKGRIDNAGHAKNYKLIQDQAERMAQVMDNMRIFSRKDAKPTGAFDLTLAARNICHLVRNPFRVDDVHIVIEGPLSGLGAQGSAVQFEQVMLNLLNNARDSILEHRQRHDLDEPGRITIALRKEAGETIVSVSDNGGGIDKEHLGHLFDPFFTTKDVGKGTGLGLAISHEIISAMSGTLDVANAEHGARFTLRLPLAAVTAQDGNDTASLSAAAQSDFPTPHNDDAKIVPIAPADGPAPSDSALDATRGGHILIVEDEVEAAFAMAEFLREEGFEVSLAHNGREGLEAYRNKRPDVVITDIRMPGMTGTDLIAALRSERADLPIIAVTGHMGETESIEHAPGAHPVKVLKKPVSLMALSREIDILGAA